MKIFDRIFKFLSSIKLAVIVILLLAVVSAVGTIYESRYDAEYAKYMVYQSPYMYAVMVLLAVNLIAVMVSRWPWKKRHIPFLLAHIGIIITLIGSILTFRYGVDGSMVFEPGRSNRWISVPQKELSVFSSFDGAQYTTLARQDVDFLLNPPTATHPYALTFGSDKLEIIDFYPFAHKKTTIEASDRENDGPAVRFSFQGPVAQFSDWIRRDGRKPSESINLGPARVVLSNGQFQYEGGNILHLYTDKNKQLRYEIYKASDKSRKTGIAKEGDVIETGWMGMTFRILRFIPLAKETTTFTKEPRPTGTTTSAIQMRFRGNEYWMGVNSVLRLFTEDSAMIISYGNKRLDSGVEMTLEKFTVGRYQGTKRAASYESRMNVEGLGPVTISMNEPLKYNGYYFYQASFEENEKGEPVASVLSVNHDPGRGLKYFGSLLIVLGSILLFYAKGRRRVST